MRYTYTLLASTAIFALASFTLTLVLSPAPIPAEYWVREMLVIKRDIAKKYAGQKKIIIASGSNTLFNIDTIQLGRELNVPVINYGLHAGLPLQTILDEAAAAVQNGDSIILPLEPPYYCDADQTSWRARNLFAWDSEKWNEFSFIERIKIIGMLSPAIFIDVPMASIRESFMPESIQGRLNALDDTNIRARLSSEKLEKFEYSAYNLDSLGNMNNTDRVHYIRSPKRADSGIKVCTASLALLTRFKEEMTDKGVELYFANTPYVALRGLNSKKVMTTSRSFSAKLSEIAPVLDDKSQLIFRRRHFFNTALHLNAKGRRIRTSILAKSIKSNSHLNARIQSD